MIRSGPSFTRIEVANFDQRNLGEYEKSLEVFRAARAAFPDSPALSAFEAITLHAAGQTDESVAALLDLVVSYVCTPDIERYKPAITGNAAHIRTLQGQHL